VGFQCPDDAQNGQAPLRRTAFGGRLRSRAEVTVVLVAVDVVLFLATLSGGGDPIWGSGDSPLYEHLAMQPVALVSGDRVVEGIADGQWWRLITSGFLHYGALHLLLNMGALVTFGPRLEHVLGRLRFLGLYLLCLIGGDVASYALGPENVQSVGASGALYGLVGASLLLGRRRGEDVTPLLAYVGIGVLLSISVPQIDWRAHLGGFVTGIAVGAVLFLPPGRRRGAVQLIGCAATLLVLAAVAAARTLVLNGTA
jgi:membrane associated rhomboid family serine protease